MSTKYTGGFITKSPVAPTSTAASGIWTLDQQQQAQKAGTWPAPPVFIEDLFSTWLYTGTGASQTITNGIDLAGNGGLVWLKGRSSGNHILQDTDRGANNYLMTDSTAATQTLAGTNFVFGSSGFSMNNSYLGWNANTNPYASWTFRQQPKFFDVVTWVGNNTVRTIAHNLGSVPGCIIVKNTENPSSWTVYHRSLGNTKHLNLNETASEFTSTSWNNTTPTTTEFTLGNLNNVNAAGDDFVAYIFAHDAGGFPASGAGSTNGISCGSYTGTSSAGNAVTLGYEPQWVMIKEATGASTGGWFMFDNMRGMPVGGNDAYLTADTTNSENTSLDLISPTATGFNLQFAGGSTNTSGRTYIYIAIRRGPMKVPTTGTSVFAPTIGVAATPTFIGNFPVDFCIAGAKGSTDKWWQSDRLRGQQRLNSATTDAESSATYVSFDNMTGCFTDSFNNYVGYVFQRAPGFFDVVCYTGNRAGRTLNHNLGVAPEMMIVKDRTVAEGWRVYHTALGTSGFLVLETASSVAPDTNIWNNTAPTASVFSVGNYGPVNETGDNFVAYLFASAPGVSKVGSYTGTGTTQTINCGFTGGARFVLIKRTDSTGDWYVWDSARGIVAGNDPYLLLNSTAAEVTNTDFVDTANVGFEISSTAPAAINASGGTFIFLAIA